MHRVGNVLLARAARWPETGSWLKRLGVISRTLDGELFSEMVADFGKLDLELYFTMLGILGATVILGLLPTSLPWNVAFLLTCTPQLLGLALIPAVLSVLPADAPGGAGWFPLRRAGGPPAPVTRVCPSPPSASS